MMPWLLLLRLLLLLLRLLLLLLRLRWRPARRLRWLL